MSRVPRRQYAYLFGMYLGDGCISTHQRDVYRLRIALDLRYPAIVDECATAMKSVMPNNVVAIKKINGENTMEVSSYSKAWPVLFPQHGPGPKHSRKIELVDWQRDI